jgi:predicted nuclease of predicted toxin-antitoxin system
MRILADENVSALIVVALRAAGVEVLSVAETIPGASDTAVLDMAREGHMGLMTCDHDFGELVIRQRHRVACLVVLELDRMTPLRAAEHVAALFLSESAPRDGELLIVQPARLRRRPLQAPSVNS